MVAKCAPGADKQWISLNLYGIQRSTLSGCRDMRRLGTVTGLQQFHTQVLRGRLRPHKGRLDPEFEHR